MPTDTSDLVQLTRAYHFAATRHVDQRRKGAAAEPYINHLTEVAELVAGATQGQDLNLIIAAVLHDAIEDTPTTLKELEDHFGQDVAGLVAEVSDDKSLPKQVRKDLQAEHAAHASERVQVLKLADKIANLRALATSPPPDWSSSRIAEYAEWASKVVAQCRSASPALAYEFDRAVAALANRDAPGAKG